MSDGLARIAALLAGEPLPAAAVDLDAFERNARHFVAACAAAGKRLRVATKSVRSPALLARLRELCGATLAGVMTYTAAETEFLSRFGWHDLLLAYPTAQPADAAALADANARGAVAAVVVDDEAQLPPLAAAARRAHATIPVVIDVDMSLRGLGGALHVGVRRSPVHDVAPALALARAVAATDGLRFHGVMGYEAQIAGLSDRDPGRRLIKRLSRPAVAARRGAVVDALRAAGLAPSLVNGGGTGSVADAAADPSLTEITVGSGFLAGHLFDGYAGLALAPALLFALQVVRRPAPGLVTCHGGGFVASGPAGADRLPRPVYPPGCALLPLEGAGEVQTPVRLPRGVDVALGAPVLFRHAKSGELAEHVNEYLLVRAGALEGRAPTYRGLGRCFLG